MNIQQMTSEDLELRLMAITTLAPHMPPPESTFQWMTEAVQELQLRRLARSAG